MTKPTTQERKILSLPVKLTADELRTRGADLAKCYADRELEELNKKIVSQLSKERIDTINAKAKKIVEALRTQKEDREVECIEEIDYQKNIANTYRTDTDPWEVVASRGLTREELQLNFKGFPKEVPSNAKDETADQVEDKKTEEVSGDTTATTETIVSTIEESKEETKTEAQPLPDTPDTKPGAAIVEMKRPKKAN